MKKIFVFVTALALVGCTSTEQTYHDNAAIYCANRHAPKPTRIIAAPDFETSHNYVCEVNVNDVWIPEANLPQ